MAPRRPPFVHRVRQKHPQQTVEVWFQDEARIGQQGTLTHLWANAFREKLASWETSLIHAAWPLAQTRPGRPAPALNALLRLDVSNCGRSSSGLCQIAAHTRVWLFSSRVHKAPHCHAQLTHTASRTRGIASSSVWDSAHAFSMNSRTSSWGVVSCITVSQIIPPVPCESCGHDPVRHRTKVRPG